MILPCLKPAQAFAHAGEPHGGSAPWTFDPWIVAPLLISASLYAVGTLILWRRVGPGRGVRSWQAASYTFGWLMLAGALVSPLHWLGEHLFTFHMIEHEVMMALAAPLIAVARPFGAFLWALPKSIRTRVARLSRTRAAAILWRRLTQPRNATIIHGAAIWIWHAPPLFDAAVTNLPVHRLQHLIFLVTALLFWWALVRRADCGTAAAHLIVTTLHTGALGALIALAPRVIYKAQTAAATEWGLTPLEDQQLAGLVMWVPAGTIYAGAALAFAALWITRSARHPHREWAVRERSR
jgi:cytochrome c oxidase assembly factor CtaG